MQKMQVKLDSHRKKIPPNTAEPTGLLLGESLEHFSHNRLIRCLKLWYGTVGLLILATIAVIYGWSAIVSVVTGAVAAYLLLGVLYLCWYGWFVRCNRRYKPLCPKCTSRMWQLCCARCREPVPPLTLWLRGIFLAHCPHCGFRLSDRKHTLLAWCSTCTATYPEPHELYFKPTYIIVWITTSLPAEVKGGWELLTAECDQTMVLYHRGDKHSASLMYIRSNYEPAEMPLPEHLCNLTRLLIISSDVPHELAQHARWPLGTRTMVVQIPPM